MPQIVGCARVGGLDLEEGVPFWPFGAGPREPLAIQPVLGDRCVAAEGLPRGVYIKGLDELTDTQQRRRPRLVVAAELVPGQRGEVGRGSRGEDRIELAFGLGGEFQVTG